MLFERRDLILQSLLFVFQLILMQRKSSGSDVIDVCHYFLGLHLDDVFGDDVEFTLNTFLFFVELFDLLS